MCKDELEREIKIEFFRSVPSGRHKNLGQMTLSLAQLREGTKDYDLDRNKGKFELANLKIER